jgi:hypothetical protein
MVASGLLPSGSNDDERKAHDKRGVESLVAVLGVPRERILNQQRTITNNDKSNIILVEFDSHSTRDNALRTAGNLKGNASYERVFISRDMTKAERMAEKALREERNRRNSALTEKGTGRKSRGLHKGGLFYWGIRFGEIRRIFEKPI